MSPLPFQRSEISHQITQLLFAQARRKTCGHQCRNHLTSGDILFRQGNRPRRRRAAIPYDVISLALNVSRDRRSRRCGESNRLESFLDLAVRPEDGFYDLIERHPGTDAVQRRTDHSTLVPDTMTGHAGELREVKYFRPFFHIAVARPHLRDETGNAGGIILRRTGLPPDR